MKPFAVALVAGFSSFALATSSALATDQQKFDKLIAKYATTVNDIFNGFKLKGACVCMNGGAAQNDAGVLYRSGNHVYCGLPSFTPAGDFNILGQCDVFEVLSK